MIYLDTSFVAPYYLNETTSDAVEGILQGTSQQIAISDWTLAEFGSLLARLVRMNELSSQVASDTMQLLVLDASDALFAIEPTRADFTLARQLLLADPQLGLRTPDALHLALVANRKLTLYTLDRTLLSAAEALGIEATHAGVLR